MKVGCPNCGGNIKFVPEKQLCVCDSCKSEIQINDIKYNECNYDNYKCSSCGGILISDETTLITICPYCNSHQLVKTKYDGIFKPNKIIPFKFGNKDFYDFFIKHCSSNKYSPNDLLNNINFNEIKGMYVPFKKFDLNILSCNRGKAIDRVTSENDSVKYLYKNFEYNFKMAADVVYDVSTGIKNDYTKSIGPFDFNDIVDYNPAYLCNFAAQIGDDKNEQNILIDEVHKISDEILMNKIQLDSKGNHKSFFKFNGGIKDINYEINDECNILLPIWFIKYTYKSKNFTCIMNGQNGKIIGANPIIFFKYLKGVLKSEGFWVFLFTNFLFIMLIKSKKFYDVNDVVILIIALIIINVVFFLFFFSFYSDKKKEEGISETNLINKHKIDIIKYRRYDTDVDYYNEHNGDDLYSIDTTIKNSGYVCYHDNVNNYYGLDKDRRYKYVNYND